jgi:hypothetical protein
MRWKYHILYNTWSQIVIPFLIFLKVFIPDFLQMFGSTVYLALQDNVLSHTIHNNIAVFDTAQFNVHKSTAFYFLQSGFSLVKWPTAYQYFEIILPLKYGKVNEGHICKS